MAGLINKVKDLMHKDTDTTHSKLPRTRNNCFISNSIR
jgi:hypothetical protein